MDLARAVDKFLDENSLYNSEGRRGLENFARLCRALGYQDFNGYGQMRGGACLGDIFEFLIDNPGSIETMIEWIKERRSPEWLESVKEHITPDMSEDDDDFDTSEELSSHEDYSAPKV